MIRSVGPLIVLLALGAPAIQAQDLPVVRPRAGMVITRSVRIAPGTYHLSGRGVDSSVITVRGVGITVDLTGVTLVGTPADVDPDQRSGLAILVDGGRGITLKGGRIRGYQSGIRAIGTIDLTLLDNDLSDNWRPRLFSEIGHESLIDWLSFHHNENGEWRRFGAGIALEGVHRGVIRGNTVLHGMNGLMLTRSDSLQIDANDFSFNSGLGIGLYRSTGNTIIGNRADFNVRGFSHYYRRGQDSADLLMFEQSSRNTVAYNSMTHGGDGLFLWAGQSTMDTGEGGSNDNLFIANDFSFAPTNAMEATFSRNDFVANRVVGSDHGLWGGYSYDSHVVANCFAGNRVGIAVEHGQGNIVAQNLFAYDSTAIWLWADPIQPSDWGYPKHRDTQSRDWRFEQNVFGGNRVGLRVRQTTGVTESGSRFAQVDSPRVMRDTSAFALDGREETPLAIATRPCEEEMPEVPEAWRGRIVRSSTDAPPTTEIAFQSRDAIRIDEWGPYDWATPKLWPIDSSTNAPLQVLGPTGHWTVTRHIGIESLSRGTGVSGDTIVVIPDVDREGEWRLELTDSAGRVFAFERFDPIAGWDTKYFAWSDSTTWSGTPLLSRREPALDLMWYRPPTPQIPQAHWALEATSTVDLGPGTYTLRTISDDAVQVWLDGKLVIDHWDPHESLVDNAAISSGHHDLRVRYLQVDGWVELRVEIVRGRVRSQGSPGPH